jgi:hypothetical protein
MAFSFSVGNQGFGGSQLRKKLLKHFSVSAPDIRGRERGSKFIHPTRWREAHGEAMADQFDSKTILRLFVPTILLIFFAVIGLTASL